MVCSQSSEFRCNNVCGNPLACGNHTCGSTCHFITVPRVVVGEEILERIVPKPPGVELPDPSDAPEGVWGKYGSSPPTEDFSDTENHSGSASMTERISAKSTSSRALDNCERCLLPCQKVCWQLFPTIKSAFVCYMLMMTNYFHQVLQSAKDCKKVEFVLQAIEMSDPLPLFLSGLHYLTRSSLLVCTEATCFMLTSMSPKLPYWRLQTM